MNPNKVELSGHVRYVHVNNKTTYAVEVVDTPDGKELVVAFASATCHDKDQFCRQTGRVKAAGRLQSKKWRNVLPGTHTFKEFVILAKTVEPVECKDGHCACGLEGCC